MEKSSKHVRAGFTLIELALAALLVGIGLVSLIALGRHAVRAALEVEDERRATALAEDLFATLRSASSTVYQTQGYDACLEFWQAVTNSAPKDIVAWIPGEHHGLLQPPMLENDAAEEEDDMEIPFPFYHTAERKGDYVFRPLFGWWEGTRPMWEARYNIGIELKNFLSDDLQPDVVAVTLHIRPRTTHLKTEATQYTEYLTFFTHIPLEPLRQTLWRADETE